MHCKVNILFNNSINHRMDPSEEESSNSSCDSTGKTHHVNNNNNNKQITKWVLFDPSISIKSNWSYAWDGVGSPGSRRGGGGRGLRGWKQVSRGTHTVRTRNVL